MKLSKDMLRKIVKEEHQKLVDANGKKVPEGEEYKPGEEADTLEKPIDVAKALKIEETKLEARLKVIRERRTQIIKKLCGE